MSRRVPSDEELRAWLLERIEEVHRALRESAASSTLPSAQEGEYRRLLAALEDLDRRVRKTFGEKKRDS